VSGLVRLCSAVGEPPPHPECPSRDWEPPVPAASCVLNARPANLSLNKQTWVRMGGSMLVQQGQ
jgi:hypothetical protein